MKKENLYLKHRCYFFESVGTIIYEPVRHGESEPWSAIVEVSPDLSDYYRYHFLNRFKVSLLKPNWKAHISLFRGEGEYRAEMEQYWKEMDGHEVVFHYTQDVFWNESFVWINTYFPEFFLLREKMGLANTHENNESWGHITIGKFRKPGQMGNFTDYHYPLPKKY